MRCTRIMEELEKLAPRACACSWDNPGLLAGRSDKEILKILIALDADDGAVDMAVRENCDLLLTHHPLIFKALKKVSDQDLIGRRILKLIRADISYYAMHTNFDSVPGGMADLAVQRLEICDTVPLEIMGGWPETGKAYGIGACGQLRRPVPLKELALMVKEKFGLPFVNVYGAEEEDRLISRAAVCPGSGKGMSDPALALGAQVLITGDMGHHEGIDAAARGLAVIDGGHYGLEHIFTDFMETYLRTQVSPQLTIIKAPVSYPVTAW